MSFLSRLFRTRHTTPAAPALRLASERRWWVFAAERDVADGDPFWVAAVALWVAENERLPRCELAACAVCGSLHEGDTLVLRADAWSDALLRVCTHCADDPHNSGLEPAPEDAPDDTPRPALVRYGTTALAEYEARTARRRAGDWS